MMLVTAWIVMIGVYPVFFLLGLEVLLWVTLSKITAHVRGFNPRIVWPIVLAVSAIPPMNAVALFSLEAVKGWFSVVFMGVEVKLYWPDDGSHLVVTSIVLLSGSLVSWIAATLLRGWRGRVFEPRGAV